MRAGRPFTDIVSRPVLLLLLACASLSCQQAAVGCDKPFSQFMTMFPLYPPESVQIAGTAMAGCLSQACPGCADKASSLSCTVPGVMSGAPRNILSHTRLR